MMKSLRLPHLFARQDTFHTPDSKSRSNSHSNSHSNGRSNGRSNSSNRLSNSHCNTNCLTGMWSSSKNKKKSPRRAQSQPVREQQQSQQAERPAGTESPAFAFAVPGAARQKSRRQQLLRRDPRDANAVTDAEGRRGDAAASTGRGPAAAAGASGTSRPGLTSTVRRSPSSPPQRLPQPQQMPRSSSAPRPRPHPREADPRWRHMMLPAPKPHPFMAPLRPLPLLRGGSDNSAGGDDKEADYLILGVCEPPLPIRTASCDNAFDVNDDNMDDVIDIGIDHRMEERLPKARANLAPVDLDEDVDDDDDDDVCKISDRNTSLTMSTSSLSGTSPVDLDELEDATRASFYGLLSSVEDSLRSSPKYGQCKHNLAASSHRLVASSWASSSSLLRKQRSLPAISLSWSIEEEEEIQSHILNGSCSGSGTAGIGIHRPTLSFDTTSTSFFEDSTTDLEEDESELEGLAGNDESSEDSDDGDSILGFRPMESATSLVRTANYFIFNKFGDDDDEVSDEVSDDDDDDDSVDPIPKERFDRLASFLFLLVKPEALLGRSDRMNGDWMQLVCVAAYLQEELEWSVSTALTMASCSMNGDGSKQTAFTTILSASSASDLGDERQQKPSSKCPPPSSSAWTRSLSFSSNDDDDSSSSSSSDSNDAEDDDRKVLYSLSPVRAHEAAEEEDLERRRVSSSPASSSSSTTTSPYVALAAIQYCVLDRLVMPMVLLLSSSPSSSSSDEDS